MSGSTRSWEMQGQMAKEAMNALRFLVGTWEGEGLDHGVPVRALATGRLLLDGTWLEVHERLVDDVGQVIHEDLTLYRFDPVEEHHRVMHIMGHAHLREYPLRADAQGARWTMGPESPQVRLVPEPGGWRGEVRFIDEEDGVVIHYRPAAP